jgi:hypothetical protein
MYFETMAHMKHEVWRDPADLTMLCLTGKRGADARALLAPGSVLIHSFYAASYFDAMNKYYAFMEWGEYDASYAWDIKPYPQEWADDV